MTTHPHDALFKRTFGQVEHARGLLQSMLPPELSAAADWSTLSPCDGSFVDADLGARHSDLLYAVKLGGREALLYVVLEHQSSSDPWMVLRMLGYVLRVYDRHREDVSGTARLPFVFPLVVHHSATGWSHSTRLRTLIDLPPALLSHAAPYVPDFELALLDLSREEDASLHARLSTDLSRLVALLLKHAAYRPNFLELLEQWVELMQRVLRAPGGLAGLSAALSYILEVTDVAPEQLRDVLESGVGEQSSEALMSTAQRLRDEGRAQGRLEGKAEGRLEGKAEGRAETLLKLLSLRFGQLPEQVVTRAQHASLEELDELTERVLTVASLDDLWDLRSKP